MMIRHDWTMEELQDLYDQPLLGLIRDAGKVHELHHHPLEVQVCSLISIKTGGCPEDCKYCAQSSHYQTSVKASPLLEHDEVLSLAKKAIQNGATRVCLGAAWREVRDSSQFDSVLHMIKSIRDLGVEVCCTLGMLKPHQAEKLKEAGLYAYNHNLDSSENFYKTIITTRTYQERLQTLDIVEKTGLSVCCGAIFGMGESVRDRLEFLHTLSRREPHPESIPINRLATIIGTPLEKAPPMPIWEFIRMIAVTRIVIPKAMIRLSAGRIQMTPVEQALSFLAGANSIFAGEKLLTIANSPIDQDKELFELLGLKTRHAKI